MVHSHSSPGQTSRERQTNLSWKKRALAGIAPLLALILGAFVIGNMSELAKWVWESPLLFWTTLASVSALAVVWVVVPRRAAIAGLIIAVLPWSVGATTAYVAAYTTPAWATEVLDEASRSSMFMLYWSESLESLALGALLSALLILGQAAAVFASATKGDSTSTLRERFVLPGVVLMLAALALASPPADPLHVFVVAAPVAILLYLSSRYLVGSERARLQGIAILSLFAHGHFLKFANRCNFYKSASGADWPSGFSSVTGNAELPSVYRLISDPDTFRQIVDAEIPSVWAGPLFALAFVILFSARAAPKSSRPE